MTEKTLNICEPCRDDHHAECAEVNDKPCECLICVGEEIGDEVIGEVGGNMPRWGH